MIKRSERGRERGIRDATRSRRNTGEGARVRQKKGKMREKERLERVGRW
jgi:hypothetical protein